MAEGNENNWTPKCHVTWRAPTHLNPYSQPCVRKNVFCFFHSSASRKPHLSHRYFSLLFKTGSVTLTSLKPNLSICSLGAIIFARAFGNGCWKLGFTTMKLMTFSVLQPSSSVVVTLQAGLIIPRENWACLMLSKGLANTDFYLFILK